MYRVPDVPNVTFLKCGTFGTWYGAAILIHDERNHTCRLDIDHIYVYTIIKGDDLYE